jgi:hypothetical protein
VYQDFWIENFHSKFKERLDNKEKNHDIKNELFLLAFIGFGKTKTQTWFGKFILIN